MRKQLQQANELKLLTHGGIAHILSVLAHDLEIGNIKEHVVHVVKYFPNHNPASARYHQKGSQCLVLPQDARRTMCD